MSTPYQKIIEWSRRFLAFARDVDIRVKILLPSLAFLIIPYINVVLWSNASQDEKIDQLIENDANARYQQMQTSIKLLSQKALEMAHVFAGMESVQEAYQSYHTDSISELQSAMSLKYSLDHLLKQLPRDYGNNYKFHFFVPPAKSLLRSWSNNRLDDLSLFRKGVLSVTNNQEPVQGLEIGINGLMVRGISPVFSGADGTFYGAVETMIPFTEVVKHAGLSDNEDFAVYVRSGLLESSQVEVNVMDERIDTARQSQAENFVVADYSSQRLDFDVVPELDMNTFLKSDQQELALQKGSKQFYVYKIMNFRDEPLGTLVYQRDISPFIQEQQQTFLKQFLVLVGYLIAALIVMLFVTSLIFSPLQKMLYFVDELSAGNIYKELHVSFKDQIGRLVLKLNQLATNLRRMVNFSDQIVNGNFAEKFEPLGEKDYMGNSLVALRDNLQQAKEEEQERRAEDQKRRWANEGRTQINEVIHKYAKNLSVLSASIIRAVIDYLEANQGAIFIVKEQENKADILELKAMYAGNYRRYENITIEMGEGLLGMAAQDHLTVYRTNVPEHFMRIRSGLGEAAPTTLIIIPLVFEGRIYGALELGSFREYGQFQIDFLEEAGETIASAIANLKISERTERLLEQSRQQASELATKEEQMRKNLERMQQAEKEAREVEERTHGVVNAFNEVLIRANFKLNGSLSYANTLFLKTMNYLEREVSEFSTDDFLTYQKEDDQDIKFNRKWQNLTSKGVSFVHEAPFKTRNSTLWLKGFFSPIKGEDGQIAEVLFVGFDMDQERRENLFYQQEKAAIERGVVKILYKSDGTLVSKNQHQTNLLADSKTFNIQNIFDLLVDEREEAHFKNIWDRVLGDQVVHNLERFKNDEDQDIWLKGVYIPLKNEADTIAYILYLACDVTEVVKQSGNDNMQPDYLK